MDSFFPEKFTIYIIDAMSKKVFDMQSKCVNLATRLKLCEGLADMLKDDFSIKVLPYKQVGSKEEAIQLHELYAEKGHDAIILRALHIDTCKRVLIGGWYKHGRASKNQKMLWKYGNLLRK